MSDANANPLNNRRMFQAGLVGGAPYQGDEGLYSNSLRGKQIRVEPGATDIQIGAAMDAHVIQRWRANVSVTLPPDVVTAFPDHLALTFTIVSSIESEVISRRVQVPLGGAQTTFFVGRSFTLKVSNPSGLALDANYGVDGQYTATPALWTDSESLHVLQLAGTDLNIPQFAKRMTILQPSVSGGLTLVGTNTAGTICYDEFIPANRVEDISISPGLHYTVTGFVGPVDTNIIYFCEG